MAGLESAAVANPHEHSVADGLEATPGAPLVVDLDGTLTPADTLHEAFAAAFFRNPLATLWIAVAALLTGGRARLKAALAARAPLEVETLPLCAPLVAYLAEQRGLGRELHLATAADRSLAEAVAARLGLFDSIHASDGARNLKGAAKAEALQRAFPEGFSYAGDCAADLPVWRQARTGVVVSSHRLAARAGAVTEVERHIVPEPAGPKAWLRAARPHQWSKNLLVLAPTVLGWMQVTPAALARTLIAMVLLCALSSLTYIVNDVADVQADRRHASKRRRPFAAGAIPVWQGLAAGLVGIPLVLTAAVYLTSMATAACLAGYCVITLAYSMGLKRVPLLDCMIIGALFTVRVVTGVTAGALEWSPWLLAFSGTLFFSLALAKRHTELVAAGPEASGTVRGRGYRYEDRMLTLVFGIATSTLSILIVALYLMEEVFPTGAYRHPLWLWVAPPVLFLWAGRIWLLANRGQMHDDPVAFALRDWVSALIGVVMAAAFAAAVL